MRPTEIPGLICRPAETAEELHELLQLQASVYVNRGFVSDPTGSDLRDRWVEASIYFGAFHEGKAVGVARLIPHSADFHLWGIFDLHPAWDRAFAGANSMR